MGFIVSDSSLYLYQFILLIILSMKKEENTEI